MRRLFRRGVVLVGVAAVLLPLGGGAATAKSDATDVQRQKTLVVGIRQVGEVFDPTSTLPAEISAVTMNVIQWLWNRTAKGQVTPGLVTQWQVSPDAKTIDLTLRRNVRFHSGDPFSADDVVFSWQRLKDNNFSDRVARSLTRIEVLDSHRVRIHLGAAEIGFVPQLGFPIVSKAYHERVGEQRFKTNPVGTGPYRFVKLQRGQYVELAAFRNYWGRKPEVQRVRMRFVTEDTTRLAALRKGEVDIVMQVPYQNAPAIDKAKNLKTVRLSPGGFTVFVAPKYLSPRTPWSKKEVREAIALAIDRRAIVRSLLKGIPDSYPFLAPSDTGYDASLQHYPYNAQRARDLLREAGYPNGFETELPYIAGAATGVKETAEAVALYLSRVGIRARPVPLEGPRFVEYVLKASRDPNQDYLAVFIGAVAGKSESTIGLVTQFSQITPFAWYRNPQVNGLVLRAAGIVNDAARADLIKQIGRMIKDDVGFIPLWSSVSVYGMRECIRFTPRPGDLDLMLIHDVSVKKCT